MPIINTSRVLGDLPLAMGAYGTGPGTTGRIVGNAAPVKVEQFDPTPGSGFQGTLYKDPATGKYTVAFAGTNDLTDLVASDRVLATSNLLTNIGAGAWDPQMTDALKFTIESFKQIQKEEFSTTGKLLSLDELRERVNVTGHSLGGSLAELAAKFFGLNGTNIDGPGITASTRQAEYTALQNEAQTAFVGMQSDYSLNSEQFGAYAYTVVGVAGTHLDGVEVQRTPRADAALTAMVTATGGVLTSNLPAVLVSLGVAGASALAHPSGSILLETEGFAGVSAQGRLPVSPYEMATLLPGRSSIWVGYSSTLTARSIDSDARTVETNVRNGLSPMGLPLDASGSRMGPFLVTAFRHPDTGRIEEVYTPVNSAGDATGSPVVKRYAVDEAGRVGQFDDSGKLNFVIHDDAGHVGVVSISQTGQVRVQDATGKTSDLAVPSIIAADMLAGKGGWLETVREQNPISWFDKSEDAPSTTVSPPDLRTPTHAETVVYNGNIYTVGPLGTLDRKIPGHGNWTESRDGTGGGVIMDDQGYTVAHLQPGDRVSMMDDGRIVVNDMDGKVVNRVVDEAVGKSFYTPASPIIELPPDSQVPTDGASAGSGLEDTGQGSEDPTPPTAPEPNPYSYTNYLNSAGAGLSPHQQTGLALQLDGLNLGGEGTLSFITLPGGATLIQNADGEIVGEINQNANGYTRLSGVRINEDGSAEPYTSYVAPDGQALSPAQYEQAQYSQATSAIGLMNSIIGLQHWEAMSNLQRVAAVASMYNAVDKLAGGTLPGELGGAVSVLGLLNALDQGNIGSALVSGISVVDFFAQDMASKAIGSALGIQAGNVVPGIGLLIALDSGDPLSVVSAALAFIPGWGQAAAIFLSIAGSMFESDIPMKEGQAHAQWDAQGNTQVITDQDTEGGGATAASWMNSIAAGLQAQLAATRDAAGNSYALIPNLLPAIGYQYDADGMNYGSAPGHMYLKWTDDNGQSQTRYYDGAGNRADGTGETLASDFMAHAQGAIAPAWQVQTVLAHWQQGQGIRLPDSQASLPQELADGIHQTLQALTLELPSPPTLTNGLIDIDGDGYLEKTQWVAANQQIVTIDANGDGQIGAGELISLGGSALNSLNWLDANNDKVLNASDPAFGALRLWMDINSDGNSSGETQTLSQAGITAIDFGSNPPAVVRSDGSREALTAQTLTGDVLGVRYTATVGGVLEAKERGETVLHAVNTRLFDGQADHMHGGALDTDGTAEGQAVLINAQDSRLSTTTARTLANRPVFVPIAATTQAQAQREVTQAMVASAGSSLFGATIGAAPLTALALAAGAVQWPAVAAANSTGAPVEEGAASSATTTSASQAAGVQPTPAAGTLATSAGPASSTPATPADPMRIDLSALQIGRVITGEQPIADEGQAVPAFDASNQALAQAGWAQAATDSVANQTSSSIATASSSDAVGGLSATLQGSAGSGDDMQLTYPTVMGELIAGTEDIGLRIAAALLLANDSTLNAGDPSRPLLSISAVGSPSHGQVALRINEAGATEVVFIPETNYHGPASFVYTVTDQYGLSTQATASLEIASVNDAPTPVADAASGDEDTSLMFTAASLLANDFDVDSAVDGDVLRITRVGLAAHGQVFLQADGNIRFVPDLNYNGPAQFSYWVADRNESAMAAMATASGASIPGGVGLESPGTMHLTVLPVNDLPVVTGEAIASDEDIVLTINPALLLANDSDVDTATNGQVLTISAVSGAQHGAVVLLADGTVQFTPEQDYFGPASFVYTVDDGHGGQVQSTAVVNLASVNDVPVVNDELLIGKRNATYTLSQAALLANDTDLETPGSLTIVAVQGMSHGTAVLNANGSVTFAPEPGYAGRGRFEYVVQDADGGQAVAATEIDFATINANPIATDDSFIGFEDIAFVIQANQLLANDADPDASGLAALTVDAVRNASHGSVSLQADGSVRFDPVANFYGTASFQYRSNDGEGGQTWATAYLNVQSVNDAPVITNIWYASGDDATATSMPASPETGEQPTYFLQDDPYRQNGGVIAYDPDGDSSAITLSISGGPQHGHAWANVVVPSSAPIFLTYDAAPPYFVPQAGAWQYFSHQGDPYSGSDPFTVTVTDGQGASTSAMVYAAHQGSSAGGGGKCPIVVDLNGDGIELIRPEDSDIFADINGDGWRERIGWAADEDGVLTFDANRDGRITENAEVSFVGYKEGARTDLDGLAAFDTDGDGKLNAGDAAWSQFGVLRDANGNGRQDEGELVSLDQLGVTAIGLQRQGSPRLDNGNVVFGTTDVTYADGHTGQAGDVMFAGENVPLPQAVLAVLPPPTEEEDVARLALLMSQYGALAEGASEPLGFVDWTQASPTQSPAEAMASALVQTDHFGTSPTGNP